MGWRCWPWSTRTGKRTGSWGSPNSRSGSRRSAWLGPALNSYPKDDGRNGQHRPVVDGALLITRGYPPKLLEAVDRPLDHVALAVGFLVEVSYLPLVFLVSDHRPDASLTQIGADLLSGVAFVPNHAIRTGSWPTSPRSLDGCRFHQRFECALLVALSGRDEQHQRLAAPSTRTWSLVVNPPRLRPNASPVGSLAA